MTDAPNAAQAEYWNAARHWVDDVTGHDQMLEPLGRAAMEALGPRPGMRVLDVGCGTGASTRALAEAVVPDGEAVGVDVSALLLGVARERGGDNVAYIEADVQTYDFEPASFDGAFSRFGVMFFSDPVAAFANVRRALRRTGRLAFVCWQSASANQWWSVPAAAVSSWVDVNFDPDAPGPFAFAGRERLERILDAAGFVDVTISDVRIPILLGGPGDIETAFDYLASSRFGRVIEEEASDPEAALAAARDALRPYVTTEGVRMLASVWVVTARV